jgi:hypothetical protein
MPRSTERISLLLLPEPAHEHTRGEAQGENREEFYASRQCRLLLMPCGHFFMRAPGPVRVQEHAQNFAMKECGESENKRPAFIRLEIPIVVDLLKQTFPLHSRSLRSI